MSSDMLLVHIRVLQYRKISLCHEFQISGIMSEYSM
jgi:hypothetical protein